MLQAKEADVQSISVYKLSTPKHNLQLNMDGEIVTAALVQYAFTPKIKDDAECVAGDKKITFRAWNQRSLLGVRSSIKQWTSHNIIVPEYAVIEDGTQHPIVVEWPYEHWVSGEAPFGFHIIGRLGAAISGVHMVEPTYGEAGGYTAAIPEPEAEIVEPKEVKEEKAIICYTGDPFVVLPDGRFMDFKELSKPEEKRFIVPADFMEFYESNPKYILNWVKKRLNKFIVDEDVEDWAQELTMHMKYLPASSKYRTAGKEDVVQTFDPYKLYGANEARFRSYINNCLANKMMTGQSKHGKNPVCRMDTMSLTSDESSMEEEYTGEGTAEYIYSKSEYLSTMSAAQAKREEDRLYTSQFIAFVEREDPSMLPAIEALMSTNTQRQAAEMLQSGGILGEDGDFTRFRNRLKVLAKCFLSGEEVPKTRSPYTRKTKAEVPDVESASLAPTPEMAATENKVVPSIEKTEKNMETTYKVVEISGAYGTHTMPNPNDATRYTVTTLVPFAASGVLQSGNCPWANPRIGFDPTKKSGKLPEMIQAITDSAVETPAHFFEKNGGVTVVADTASFTEDGKLVISFDSSKTRGLVDGGTTTNTLYRLINKHPELASTGYFKLEIRCGNFTSDEVSDIAQGLNTRKQVDDFSLANQRGEFDWIRDILTKGKDGYAPVPKVSYFKGDSGELEIDEVVKVLCAFGMKNPADAYNSIQKCLEFHASDEGNTELKKYADLLVEFIHLTEYIPAKFTAMTGFYEKLKKNPAMKSFFAKKPVTMPMTGATTDLVFSNAVMIPLLASLKVAIDPTTMTWKVRPEVIIEKCGEDLIQNLIDTYESSNKKWQPVGRDTNLYKVLAMTVKLFIADQK